MIVSKNHSGAITEIQQSIEMATDDIIKHGIDSESKSCSNNTDDPGGDRIGDAHRAHSRPHDIGRNGNRRQMETRRI